MHNTITDKHRSRLIAQAEESDFRGFNKIAERLNQQVKISGTRNSTDDYSYSYGELINDIELIIWSAIVRSQDYFNKTADAKEMNDIVESIASELIDTVRVKIGGNPIGPYEPAVPGESRYDVEIEE